MSLSKILVCALREESKTQKLEGTSIGMVDERRVPLAPETVKKLQKKKFDVAIEAGAGIAAGFSDADYEREGARVLSKTEAYHSPVCLKISAPNDEELALFKPDTLLIAALNPHADVGRLKSYAGKRLDALALELVPRISRAQAMDILSSQANIAGYRAVLEAATLYSRFFPIMMTSAGAAKPAKVLVLGAGVAGLQAIATARRLGAQVEAFDIRSEVKEQIESLGAKFLALDFLTEGSAEGGYAKALTDEERRKQQEALQEAIPRFDIVISTASVPGRKAPVLISKTAVSRMRSGSVILDMAAATGGNCEVTKPGALHKEGGVLISGPLHLASQVAADASRFFSTNIYHLLCLFSTEAGFKIPLDDEIIDASLVTYQGQVRFPKVRGDT